MAIQPTPNQQSGAPDFRQPSAGSTFKFRQSGQPPPFRATGRGFANKLPHFPATADNANASLENLATTNKSFRKLYLFVNAVETGWELSGEVTQSQRSRAFYPRNLQQDELTIEGIVANQYEYDRIVAWVQHHHHSQFVADNLNGVESLPGDLQYPGAIFQLFKPTSSRISSHSPMRYMIVIENIQSGHQQGQMVGIPFQLTCKVVYDYLQKMIDVEQQVKKLVDIHAVFGNVSNPSTSSWEDSEAAITTSTEDLSEAAQQQLSTHT